MERDAPRVAPRDAFAPVDVSVLSSTVLSTSGAFASLMTPSVSGMHVQHVDADQAARASLGQCQICFVVSTKMCSCKVVYYCSAAHQKEHWQEHKKTCKEGRVQRDAAKARAASIRGPGAAVVKLPPKSPLASWSKQLDQNAKYEWLVDCYRMRVDDDCEHGQKRRGLYLVGVEAQATQSQVSKTRIVLDFLLFVKLALAKGAIPALDWDYAKLIQRAQRLLCVPFAKRDAINKYGSENVFAAGSGGRSLRYTAEHIYCTSVQNPSYSEDADYMRIKSEILSTVPLSVDAPIREGFEDYIFETVGDDERDAATIRRFLQSSEVEEIFDEVGGVALWRQLLLALRL